MHSRAFSKSTWVVEALLDADIGIAKHFSTIVIKTPVEGRPPPAALFGEPGG